MVNETELEGYQAAFWAFIDRGNRCNDKRFHQMWNRRSRSYKGSGLCEDPWYEDPLYDEAR